MVLIVYYDKKIDYIIVLFNNKITSYYQKILKMTQTLFFFILLNLLQMSLSQRLQPMHVHETLDASSFFNRTLTIGLTIARDSVKNNY